MEETVYLDFPPKKYKQFSARNSTWNIYLQSVLKGLTVFCFVFHTSVKDNSDIYGYLLKVKKKI